jgi:hypothetical protein
MTPAGKSLGTARHEQPKELEPGFLGEGAECRDRAFLIHCVIHCVT